MAKRDERNKGPLGSPGEELKHNPFAALAGRVAPGLAPAPTPPPEAALPAAPAATEKAGKPRGRVVLRRETKHRGGKAVIVATGFEAMRAFGRADVETLAKALKQSLGCGGTVEEGRGTLSIVLQGDRAAAVAELLRAQGFRVDGVTS